jgi:hypothetical protein
VVVVVVVVVVVLVVAVLLVVVVGCVVLVDVVVLVSVVVSSFPELDAITASATPRPNTSAISTPTATFMPELIPPPGGGGP